MEAHQLKKDSQRKKTHVQSQNVEELKALIEKYEADLKKWGVFYDYPDYVNEKGNRTKFRIMRTKGNTKSQRKNLKQNHLRILQGSGHNYRELSDYFDLMPNCR